MVKSSFFKSLGIDTGRRRGSHARGPGGLGAPGTPSQSGKIDPDVANSAQTFLDQGARPIEIVEPATLKTPVIFASPHSGRRYPADLLDVTSLDHQTLRLSEDSYVDLLFESVPRHGAPMLKALFPRAYVDVNRSRRELDPSMFQGSIGTGLDLRSSRVLAGLGVIPRIVADGRHIYQKRLPAQTAQQRLSSCYDPYHEALKGLIDKAQHQFGVAVVIDCHSMPSAGGAALRPGEPMIDFVLGDRFGVSSAPSIPGLVEAILGQHGCHVVRNAPYAGGYVANTYGRPGKGVHVLQIEINRALYLDENRITRNDGFDPLREVLDELIGELVTIDPAALRVPRAAE